MKINSIILFIALGLSGLAYSADINNSATIFKDCPDCPEMVTILAGSFNMGSPSNEAGRSYDEEPMHRVNVPAFALSKTLVTRGEFAAFVSATGYQAGSSCFTFEDRKAGERQGRNWQKPGFMQEDSHPVVCINWNDAKAYAEWISRKTGKQYRLPAEAEWEYAARAGTITARYWGDSPDQACSYANVADQTAKNNFPGNSNWAIHNCTDGYVFTSPVASFKSNAFGLYDMIGNTWEWIDDCYHDDYNGAPNDGSAWTVGCKGEFRVMRGGSWFNAPQIARAARRGKSLPMLRYGNLGFRLARMLP